MVMMILDMLPAEVWLEVGDRLSLSDRALLSTSCMKMYHLFGHCLKQIQEHQNAGDRFSYRLVLYDRLHPGELICPSCNKWHDFKSSSLFLNSFCSSPERSKDLSQFGAAWAHGLLAEVTKIPWPAVQAAMRAVRLGPSFGISLEELWGFFRHPGFFWDDDDQYKFVVADGHLLLQCRLVRELSIIVCPHLWRADEPTSPLEDLVTCAQTHIDSQGSMKDCSTCSKSYRCSQCPSEWSVGTATESAQGVDERRTARAWQRVPSNQGTGFPASVRKVVQLTKWIDLGDGISPWTKEWQQLSMVENDIGRGMLLAQGQGSLRERFKRASEQLDSGKHNL